MIINHNLGAMNAQRHMSANQNNMSNSMEKLSSGLRINRAGDDAAGLAISEKMRGQIRGLEQANRNAQDGISMIQTAEGALGETHDILQRMRELSTQAANDTNVSVDRGEIQKEMDSLTSEINRIGNTTEFNTQKVLKGSDEAKELQAGLQLNATGVMPGGETNNGATIAATEATLTVAAAADDTDGSNSTNGETVKFNLQGQEINLTVNTGGVADPTVNEDGTEVTMNIAEDTSADDMATAMETALKAAIGANDNIADDAYTISSASGDLSITSTATGSDQFIGVDGTDAPIANGFGTGADESYTASTSTFTVANVANAEAAAGLVGQGMTIDGKSVEFYNADDGAYSGDADFGVNISTVLNGDFGDSGTNLANAISTQVGDKIDGVSVTNSGDALTFTSTADGEAGDGIVIEDGADIAAVTSAGTFEASFQVGANQGQSMGVEINDMRAQALGISGNAADAEITDKDGNVVENAAYAQAKSVTDGTDNENSEFALDVSSHESAAAAVSVINNAIEKVSAERSSLGASQNRLEHTISNLDNSSENLSAAESRIRDVDMAKEMMEMTKANVLSQASQSMLAQANQQPQSVLQLLG